MSALPESKKMFGSAEKLLPYIECFNTLTRKGKLIRCKGQRRYKLSHMVFPDTSVQTDEVSLAELAAKTGVFYQAKT